jgi:hypothetical protein
VFDDEVIDSDTGITGRTFMINEFDVVVALPGQISFEVITQFITSLFTGRYENTGLFAPTTIPLTFHTYTGAVPPLTGDALKVTLVPAQTVVELVVIVTLAGITGLTVIKIVSEVTVGAIAHA